jgi:hypothetical protein
MRFFSHLVHVVQWAARDWWAFVWGNIVLAAFITAGTAVVGLYLMPIAAANFPILRPYAGGDTMDSVVQGLLLAGVAAVVLFLVFLALAPSRIYERDQRLVQKAHESIDSIRLELKEVKDSSRPRFKVTIPHIVRGSGSDGCPVLILVVRVANTGAPSILDRWRLVCPTPHGEVVGKSQQITATLTMQFSNALVEYPPHDALYVKTLASPVATGVALTGVIPFAFPDLSREEMEALDLSQLSLTCVDVHETTVHAEPILNADPSPPMIFPGTSAVGINIE